MDLLIHLLHLGVPLLPYRINRDIRQIYALLIKFHHLVVGHKYFGMIVGLPLVMGFLLCESLYGSLTVLR